MISDTTAAAAALSGSGTAAKPTRAPAALTSDFETFLKMLTAQARFQDPLEPIDSTEYAAQLAQFSMVEQQVQTNDVLKALSGLLGTQNPAALASWVGMEARAVTPMVFDGTPITLAAGVPAGAGSAFLVVRDGTGEEVQRIQVPHGVEQIEWAGVGEDGSPLPSGSYSFVIEGLTDGKVVTTQLAAVYARVTEAQLQGGEIVLIFEGGQPVPASSVTALREPV